MTTVVGVLERALQIAKTGAVSTMGELRLKLAEEGFTSMHRLEGRQVRLKIGAELKKAATRFRPAGIKTGAIQNR